MTGLRREENVFPFHLAATGRPAHQKLAIIIGSYIIECFRTNHFDMIDDTRNIALFIGHGQMFRPDTANIGFMLAGYFTVQKIHLGATNKARYKKGLWAFIKFNRRANLFNINFLPYEKLSIALSLFIRLIVSCIWFQYYLDRI